VVKAGHGLHLRSLVDFDDEGVARRCGDEWQLVGPVTYIPNPDVVSSSVCMYHVHVIVSTLIIYSCCNGSPLPLQTIVKRMSPQVITAGKALRLKARQQLTDKDGNDRFTGEEWLGRHVGGYLPGVMEEGLLLILYTIYIYIHVLRY